MQRETMDGPRQPAPNGGPLFAGPAGGQAAPTPPAQNRAAPPAVEKAPAPGQAPSRGQTSPPAAGRPGPSRGHVVMALFALGGLLAGLLLATGLRLRSLPPPHLGPVPTLAAQPRPQTGGLDAVGVMQVAGPSVVSLVMYDTGGISPTGSGSGVILSADGYIATNAHVVHGGGAIRAVLHTGQGHTATLVGTDPKTDLAVLKINARDLTPATFGTSAEVQVGEQVYIIGNAAGSLPGSLTQGVVSGVGRSLPIATTTGQVVRMNLLQTDAAINPGNSGGAMVNAFGQVIGISLGKIESANVDNIGFAIPADDALPVLQALIENGSLPPAAKLGVTCEALNETTGPPNGLPAKGLFISEVTPGSSLHQHGVGPGDVILEADGIALEDTADLLWVLARHTPGDELLLRVYLFQTGQEIEVAALLYAE